MITITHYRRELGWDRHALAFVDVPYEPHKAGYYLGLDKPNYPMPAIQNVQAYRQHDLLCCTGDKHMNKLEDTVHACYNSVNIASIYVTGWQLPPHFPMPAIPLSVGIGPNFVDLCTYDYFYGPRLASRQCWRKVKEWCR